mgnify:CR=1 FL=1
MLPPFAKCAVTESRSRFDRALPMPVGHQSPLAFSGWAPGFRLAEVEGFCGQPPNPPQREDSAVGAIDDLSL